MKIQLHRTGKRPQWAGLSQKRRNAWQRVAARTDGILTVGNFFTLFGFGLVLAGLGYVIAAGRSGSDGHEEWYIIGFGLIVVGRLCDLLDGWLAELTGTKSPLGESLDAGFDKLITLLALPALVVATILPWWAAGALALPHVFIAAISARLIRLRRVPHPSLTGKLSMAAAWLTVSMAVLAVALAPEWSDAAYVGWLAYAAGSLSVVLGTQAAIGYARQLRK